MVLVESQADLFELIVGDYFDLAGFFLKEDGGLVLFYDSAHIALHQVLFKSRGTIDLVTSFSSAYRWFRISSSSIIFF